MIRQLILVGSLCLASPAFAESAPLILRAGTPVSLVTVDALSSKRNVKGDMIALRTTADVRVDDRVIIPGGTPAVGQISDARAKGAMGMNGKVAVRPLYLRIGATIVRLKGQAAAKGTAEAGAVIGIIVLTPGFTGRNGTIAAGTKIAAEVEKDVRFDAATDAH